MTTRRSRAEVIREICHHLEPYQTARSRSPPRPIIAKDLTIDSLAIMDMIMELEDRFDVSIPLERRRRDPDRRRARRHDPISRSFEAREARHHGSVRPPRRLARSVSRRPRRPGYDPFSVRMERVLSPTEAIIDGRKTILVGTNNYFGLTFDPSCIAAAIEALGAEGTGTTGSRIANGSYGGHAGWSRSSPSSTASKHCMVFTTGYQANLGIISTLAGPGDYLIIDADSHARIYDACKMTPADGRSASSTTTPPTSTSACAGSADKPGNKHDRRRRHLPHAGRPGAAARRSSPSSKKHGAYRAGRRGPFDGRARRARPRPRRGGGRAEDDVDFIVGTFSKSLGAIGGFCVSDHPEFDILRVAVPRPTCSRPRCRPRSSPR